MTAGEGVGDRASRGVENVEQRVGDVSAGSSESGVMCCLACTMRPCFEPASSASDVDSEGSVHALSRGDGRNERR